MVGEMIDGTPTHRGQTNLPNESAEYLIGQWSVVGVQWSVVEGQRLST